MFVNIRCKENCRLLELDQKMMAAILEENDEVKRSVGMY